MSYLVPSEFVTKMVDAGESKIFMSTRDTLIRAYMAGAILALAAAWILAAVAATPSTFADVMRRLERSSGGAAEDSTLLRYLASHPLSKERIRRAESFGK